MVLQIVLLVALIVNLVVVDSACVKSITTVTMRLAPQGTICSGDLIFEDNFDDLNLKTWAHVVNDSGPYFHDYVNERHSSFTENGILKLRSVPNSEADVEQGRKRPVDSARISTRYSLAFKFGKMEVRAKLPAGDWQFPAIWLIPKAFYGNWPKSGEIDIMESRGNRQLFQDGVNIGSEQIQSTLHFGLDRNHDPWQVAHKVKNSRPHQGYDTAFHKYQMEWTPEGFKFGLDGQVFKTIEAGEGFWKKGGFDKLRPPVKNIWENGTIMAPFDKEFYVCLNVAVGGFSFFSDQAINKRGKKPWKNCDKKHGMKKFWQGRDQWLPTWEGDASAMQVDYVRIWAL